MQIRDRIKGLKRVKAGELLPNPRNWRTHPESQRNALQGILAEIGYVDALLARELPDGRLELVDGHLRAETTPDIEVPVLILDLDSDEAAKVLATFDPLANLAEADADKLDEILREVETENDALQKLLDDLARDEGITIPDESEETSSLDELQESYHVLVECDSDSQQRELLSRLTGEGYQCRALIA